MMTGQGLYRSADKVPYGQVPMQVHAGKLETQQVFGLESSLMYARRSAGYHSVPHQHDCEQLNLCIDGHMWIFVDEEGWELGAGDFLRVPRGAVHWAWNRRDTEAVLVEVHAPGLDVLPVEEVAHLLAEGERSEEIEAVPNRFLPELDVFEVERRVVGE